MSRKVKIGAIGMGQRGSMLLKDVLTKLDVMQVVAVCDEYEDRAQAAKECVLAENGFEPFCTTDYREVIHHPEVEAVLVLSAWESHINIAVECMKAGKRVGMEVGGAYSVDVLLEAGAHFGGDRRSVHASGKLLLRKKRNDGNEHGEAGSVR